MTYEPSPEHPLTTTYPYFPPQEQEWLQGELGGIMNGQLSMGPRVAEFESQFASYCGASHGIAFPSCTSSLEASMQALGVGAGDEVLVPAETFVATGMAVHLVGATPVFTEISGDTFGMDFGDAWSRITERSRGAIVVHFAGLIPPELPEFIQRMQNSGRFVIEDAAHAHGAELDGARAGSLGDVGCFSFFPTKIMTTGEGGMAVTSRDDLADTLRSLQVRGRDLESDGESYLLPGRNNRFTEIAAAIGLSQLRCLPDFLAARRHAAGVYDELLAENGSFHPIRDGGVPAYWRYLAMPERPVNRRALKSALEEDGITIDWPYDPPLHLQPVFQRLLGTEPGMLPRSERVMSRHVSLPMHAMLREEDARYVVERLVWHASRLR